MDQTETLKALTALEIARIACDIESDGLAFYRAAVDATTLEEARTLFNDLSRQELEHLNTFRNLYKQLDEKMGGAESTAEYLFDDQLTSYLRSITQGLVFPQGVDAAEWLSQHPDTGAILRFALDAEKNSVLFYAEIAAHTAFAYSRDLLNHIISEEQSHIVRLNGLLRQVG